MLQQGINTEVRFIADETGTKNKLEMVSVEPNCEDAYLYCLHQNGCAVMGGEE